MGNCASVSTHSLAWQLWPDLCANSVAHLMCTWSPLKPRLIRCSIAKLDVVGNSRVLAITAITGYTQSKCVGANVSEGVGEGVAVGVGVAAGAVCMQIPCLKVVTTNLAQRRAKH